MAGAERKALDTAVNTKEQAQLQAKNDILQSVKNYTDKLQDKEKASLITQLAPKVLDAMQIEWIDMKDIKNSKLEWKNILIDRLSKLNQKQLKVFNQWLTSWNPKYDAYKWVFKSLLEKANFIADINQTASKNIDEVKSLEAKRVKATTEAETALKAKFSDKLQNNYAEISDEKELQKIAETDLWLDYKEVKNQLANSPYKNELTIGQFFSFLKTQQTAKQKPDILQDTDYKAFEKNFKPIQETLKVYPQNRELKLDGWEIPAQDLQNLTTEQSAQIIKQTDGMQQAVWEIEEVDYDDPDFGKKITSKLWKKQKK